MHAQPLPDFDHETNSVSYVAKDSLSGQYLAFANGVGGEKVRLLSEVPVLISADERDALSDFECDWSVHYEDPRLNGTTYVFCDSHGRLYNKATMAFDTVDEVPETCLFTAAEATELSAQEEDLRSLRQTGGVAVLPFSSLIGEVELQAVDVDGHPYVTSRMAEAETAELSVFVRYHHGKIPRHEVEITEDIPADELGQVLRDTASYLPAMEPSFRSPEPELEIAPAFAV